MVLAYLGLSWPVRLMPEHSIERLAIFCVTAFLILSILCVQPVFNDESGNGVTIDRTDPPVANNDPIGEPRLLESRSVYTLSDGETIPADADGGRAARAEPGQPLGSDRTVLAPLEELLVFAQVVDPYDGDDDGRNHGRAYDDALEDFPQIKTWDMTEKLIQPDVATGDVDGDGRDETLYIGTAVDESYEYLKLWIWDDPTEDFAELEHREIRVNDRIEDGVVTTGDVDGDGLEEIIYAGTWNDGASKLWVLDDAGHDFAQLWAKDIYTGNGVVHPWVATGDVDGDGLDELAVSSTIGYVPGTDLWIYDDAGHDFAELKHIEVRNEGWTSQVAIGRADGDGPDEIFLLVDFGSGGSIRVYNDHANGYGILVALPYEGEQASFSLGDIDGDRMDEILLVGYHYHNHADSLDAYIWDDAHQGFDEIGEDGLPWENDIEWRATKERSNVTLGDVDCDGKAELVIAGEHRPGYQESDMLKVWVIDDMSAGFGKIKYWTDADRKDPTLALGELDDDGLILEYADEHWTTTLDPRILVAMATPPVVDGISQNYGKTGSAYGTEVSQGTGESHEVGSTAGVTVSVEAGDPFGIFKATASASFSHEFSQTQTQTSMTTYGTSYAGAYPDDVVIYEAIKYDNYKYKIVSHPDSEKVGQNITIDVPRVSLIYKESVEHFNAHNGESADIGSETFKHIPGALWSYPTVVERNKLLQDHNGWKSGDTPVPVGQGGGTTSVSLNLAEESTTEESRTMGFEVSAGFAVGGVGFEASYGAFETEVFSITVGESTEYEGTVGDIVESEDYEKFNYAFGMFVYNFKRSDYEGYQVINYWAQDYAGPLPDRSLLAHWDFATLEDNDTFQDSSSWQQEATVHGANLTEGPSGHGKALCFDGVDDYVSYPNLFPSSPGNLSFSFWLGLDNTSIGVPLYHGEPGEFQAKVREEDLEVSFKLASQNWTNAYFELPNLTGEIQWFRVAAIWEQGENLSLYIDGELVDNVTVPDEGLHDPGSYFQPSLGAKARGRGDWADSHFKGCLDEPRIYDRVLTAVELQGTFDDGSGDDDDDDGGFLPGSGLIMAAMAATFVAVVRRRD